MTNEQNDIKTMRDQNDQFNLQSDRDCKKSILVLQIRKQLIEVEYYQEIKDFVSRDAKINCIDAIIKEYKTL